MTEYQVEIASSAKADMLEIVRYIGEALREPRTAARLYQRLRTEIASLSSLPERCPLEREARARELGIRCLLVKNYKVLYLVDRERRVVQVARVLYAGRDIAKLLEDTNLEEYQPS